MTEAVTYTQSSIGTFRACPRLYKFKYEDGYRPAMVKETLRVGSLIHLGLEAWWQNFHLVARLGFAFDAMRDKADSEIDRIRAEEMLRGYDARWGGDPHVVLGVETEFAFPLVNPKTMRTSKKAVMRGKLDVVVAEGGDPVLFEHKTTSEEIESDADNYWQRLPLDRQLSNYTLGAESLGWPVREAVYDVIRKPLTRFRTATPPDKRKYTKAGALYANQREHDETPDEYRLRLREEINENLNAYYRRRRVPRLSGEVLSFLADAWDTTQEIAEARKKGRWARNTDSCFRFGSPCPFITVCRDGVELAESLDFVKVDNVHSELNGDDNAQSADAA